MDEISIDFDQETYFPGEKVFGIVIIQCNKQVKAKNLTVCITGSAKGKYTGSEVVYVDKAATLWEAEDENSIFPMGTSIFHFTFHLPLTCPPSFEGKYGSVRYLALVETGCKTIKKMSKSVKVLTHYDLALCQISNKSFKVTGKMRQITMTAHIPKQGFIPNEIIPITLEISNQSSMILVKNVQLHIHQKTTYWKTSKYSQAIVRNQEIKCLQGSKVDINLPSGQEKVITTQIKVPETLPTFQCEVIQRNYSISMSLKDSSSFCGKLKLEIPLIIGTVASAGYVQVPEVSVPPTVPQQTEAEYENDLIRAVVESMASTGLQGNPVYEEVPEMSLESPILNATAPEWHF